MEALPGQRGLPGSVPANPLCDLARWILERHHEIVGAQLLERDVAPLVDRVAFRTAPISTALATRFVPWRPM
jgi:hypothetical protein